MDPEILQLLFQNARNKNKNVSGVLNNLDNSMLAYLAGVYDPTTQMDMGGAASQVWDTYYGNENYPELQPVLDIIAQGGDQYQAQAALDAAVAEGGTLGPFSYETARSLVNDAYKEVSGGGGKKKNDVFSKAGLPSPIDVYDESNLPLDGPLNEFLGKYSSEATRMAGLAEKAKKDVDAGRNRVDVAKKAMSSFVKALEQGGSGRVSDMAVRRLREDISKRDMITDTEWADLVEKYSPAKRGNDPVYEKQYRERVAKASKSLPKISKKDLDSISAAERRANDLMYLAKDAKANEDAVRKAFLARIQESGRTPLGDSLSAMMKFTANTSGK